MSAVEDLAEGAPSAPPVVAVVVTCDSGPWLEETLEALGRQDYPNLSVLVIDSGSAEDPTRRIATVLPTAYVRRMERNPGYGPATNEVLEVVEGASHFLLCHDDVAPEPDAVRLLVEEAYRSNAGVVGPKLVTWDDPNRLLAVGLRVDKAGTADVAVGRGELDQEQFDAVLDVFAVPGGCLLVRADLFEVLGGFDAAMAMYGEDIDLCWRAHVVGARVIVAPSARVRHLEAASAGIRPVLGAGGEDLDAVVRPLVLRHRLRTVLKCYSRFHLLRVLPQIAVLAIFEVVGAFVLRHRAAATAIAWAWRWNLSQLRGLRAARRELAQHRRVPDREVRGFQTRGSSRVRTFIRARTEDAGAGQALADAGRELAGSFRTGQLRLPLAVWASLAVVLVVGSRGLLSEGVAAVGHFTPLPAQPFDLIRLFLSGWNTSGLGSTSPTAPGLALFGALGVVLLGNETLALRVVVLGALPAGLVGAYRFARPLESRRAASVAVIAYAAVPLPYNAVAEGRLAAVVAYGAGPWILRRLAESFGQAPFAERVPRGADVIGLALLLAPVLAISPPVTLVVVVTALGLAAGALATRAASSALRPLTVAALALVASALLLFPWTLDLLAPPVQLHVLTGAFVAEQATSFGDMLKFHTGPIGAGPLAFGIAVTAVLPLLLAQEWRYEWAVRAWCVAGVSLVLSWASSVGWAPPMLLEVALVPAAIALALAAALGVAAFERELRGYRFGWRQVAAVAAGGAFLLAPLPVLVSAAGGRWDLPRQDHLDRLAWMDERQDDGGFRVLWVGHPDVLPIAGWSLDGDLAYATSRNGTPDASTLWPAASEGATRLVADAVAVATDGGTSRLGELLAPMAIRYVVVPSTPAPESGPARPVPEITEALRDQIDLRIVDSGSGLEIYENVAWLPHRAALPAEAGPALSEATGAIPPGVTGTPVLLDRTGVHRFEGSVDAGAQVYLAEAASSGWRLEVDGEVSEREKALGWANTWAIADAGRAVLSFRTGPARYLALATELALWIGAIVLVRRSRRNASGVEADA